MKRRTFLLAGSALLVLSACSRKPETGPVPIRWDQETCARCGMAISDRHYAAEVRGGPEADRTRVWKFDDIGCALLWLDEQPWKADPRVEIWVADHRTGEWLDARKAWYVSGQHSPMGFGLGAQPGPAPGALDFAKARLHVYEVERREHRHRGHAPMEH